MDKYIALTHFSNTYKYYHLAIASLRKVFSLLRVKEDMSLLPQSIIMTLLPKPFMICVEKYSRMYDIDPLIVYSVVKAESFFNPRAVSSAGAVGLMQLMPATARGIGRQLGTRNYDLKDPCTSIHFGTKYISWLKKFFKGKLPLMIAGYNAGAGNVKKWKRRRNINAIDRFIEFMPFIETRYYVIRTDKFYLQYKTIYKSK